MKKKRKMRKSEMKSYEKLEALSKVLQTITSIFLLIAIITRRLFFAVSFVITGVAGIAVVIWSMKVEREEEEEAEGWDDEDY